MAGKSNFKVFAFYQSLGFVLGWFFHGLVSHLFTGDHEHNLSVPQLIMHNIALAGMAMIVLFFHDKTTRQLWNFSLWKYWAYYLLVPVSAFWFGYYGIGMPIDIVLAFLSFALLNGLFFKNQLQIKWWILKSVLSAVFGLVVATFIVIVAEPAIITGLAGVARHAVVFLFEGSAIGIPMALAGGYMLRKVSAIA